MTLFSDAIVTQKPLATSQIQLWQRDRPAVARQSAGDFAQDYYARALTLSSLRHARNCAVVLPAL